MLRDALERGRSLSFFLSPLLFLSPPSCVCHDDVPVLGRVDKAEALNITSTLGLRRDIQSDCTPGDGDTVTVEHISSPSVFFRGFSPKNESGSGAACALSCL